MFVKLSLFFKPNEKKNSLKLQGRIFFDPINFVFGCFSLIDLDELKVTSNHVKFCTRHFWYFLNLSRKIENGRKNKHPKDVFAKGIQFKFDINSTQIYFSIKDF